MPALSEYDGDLVVASVRTVAEGVVLLEVGHPSGDPLPAGTPGAHVALDLTADLTRQYSLCGADTDGTWTVAVLRDAEGRGSVHVHDVLRPGDLIQGRGPTNQFELEPAEAHAFVAGGIGITPIVPMVRELARRAAPFRLLYGGRTRASMAFLPELTGHGAHVVVHPEDEHGLLPLETELAALAPGTLVYCCGPTALMDATAEVCERLGLSLRTERFRVATPTDSDAFEVELAQSGLVLEVPADRSILEVLEDAGVGLLSSCRAGTCGTCEVDVLDGVPEHHDMVLTEEERAGGEILLACTARSLTPRLVLDL